MSEKLSAVVMELAENIAMDTIKFGDAESAARFQFNQLVENGIDPDVANGFILMALEACG